MDHDGRGPPEGGDNETCSVTGGRTGRGREESVVMTGGGSSFTMAELRSEWKAAATNRRARKSRTCVGL